MKIMKNDNPCMGMGSSLLCTVKTLHATMMQFCWNRRKRHRSCAQTKPHKFMLLTKYIIMAWIFLGLEVKPLGLKIAFKTPFSTQWNIAQTSNNITNCYAWLTTSLVVDFYNNSSLNYLSEKWSFIVGRKCEFARCH